MNLQELSLMLTALNMSISGVVWLIVYQDRKQRVTRDSIRELEKSVAQRFDDKCLRIARLEAEIKAAPTRDEIIRVHDRIEVLQTMIQEQSQETTLLLGKLIGKLDQMNEERKYVAP